MEESTSLSRVSLGVHISIVLTELQVRGSAELTVFFASYRAQMLAILRNLTVHVDVFIGRNLDEDRTNVTVSHHKANACREFAPEILRKSIA